MSMSASLASRTNGVTLMTLIKSTFPKWASLSLSCSLNKRYFWSEVSLQLYNFDFVEELPSSEFVDSVMDFSVSVEDGVVAVDELDVITWNGAPANKTFMSLVKKSSSTLVVSEQSWQCLTGSTKHMRWS